MELHSQTAAKKIWDYLRAVLFTLKVRSVISKRKFIMDVNMFMNRSKYVGKSITNLLTHKHHPSVHHHSIRDPSLLNEYEFSCHNTPNPLFFNAKRGGNNKRGYFACLNTPVEEGGEEQEADLRTPLRLEYTSQELRDLTTPASPFDVRVSDFSSLEGEGSGGNRGSVDSEAEEFIKRFYEQLKRQREVGLLEYPQGEE
ncbi:hypothetical protein LUZ61_017801 [Rhynchospora tenuis]|uniref:Uncharacterized protein n=1 Tax=Rhynchospora tenuis TaxID=198213 RepID=A0AAD6ELB6_9POAL|nr:hypothetical protein LUZ61_017801 [Rhynchospora tenuis]